MAHPIQTEVQVRILRTFIGACKQDPRICTSHISMFVGLLINWEEKRFEHPFRVFSHELMPLCKISGAATYHQRIRDLNDYGYIVYTPSYNHFLGSLVYFPAIPITPKADARKCTGKYFLVSEKQDWRIMKVNGSEVREFQHKYRDVIISEADLLTELLVLSIPKMEGRCFWHEEQGA